METGTQMGSYALQVGGSLYHHCKVSRPVNRKAKFVVFHSQVRVSIEAVQNKGDRVDTTKRWANCRRWNPNRS